MLVLLIRTCISIYSDGVLNFDSDLDHTADVQLHAWGSNLKHAFENIAPCMFNYMTDLSIVEVKTDKTLDITVTGLYFS